MPAPPAITELAARFHRNLKDYQSGKYNETQVRLEFIDPFFEALGWDIHNKKVTLVESMLALHKQLTAAKTPVEKQMIQHQIDTTD